MVGQRILKIKSDGSIINLLSPVFISSCETLDIWVVYEYCLWDVASIRTIRLSLTLNWTLQVG